jgi:hypothetical protein
MRDLINMGGWSGPRMFVAARACQRHATAAPKPDYGQLAEARV